MALRRINNKRLTKMKVSDKTPQGVNCPSCNSYKIRLIEKRENNGIIGPGFSSWVVDSYYSCTDCETRFDKIEDANK